MPITIDSRGVSVYITDDDARAQATELAARAEQALDIADARGWPLNASDAQRVQHDLDEAAKLLTDIGEYKQLSGPVDLARFYAPGESEAILAGRADAEQRRRDQSRDQARRMAEAALMIDELGEDDPDSSDPPTNSLGRTAVRPASTGESTIAPERPNMKRTFDSHGLEWWTVSGRGDTKRYADYATAERELKRRAGRA